MLDALSLAVWSALGTTLVPKLIVSGEGEEMEIEVSDNPHDSTRIDVTKAPLIVTLTQVRDNIIHIKALTVHGLNFDLLNTSQIVSPLSYWNS